MKEIKTFPINFLLTTAGIISVMVTCCRSSCSQISGSTPAFPTSFSLVVSLYSVSLIGDHHSTLVAVTVEKYYEGQGPHGRFRRSESEPVNKNKSANSSTSSSSPVHAAVESSTRKGPVVKTIHIPDRTPANYTAPPLPKEDVESSGETDDEGSGPSSNSTFNMKAVERTLIVIAGIAVIILIYVGVKIIFLSKGRKFGRYGIVETSEMDLLEDKIEEDEEESEEEELFDINRHRRRPF